MQNTLVIPYASVCTDSAACLLLYPSRTPCFFQISMSALRPLQGRDDSERPEGPRCRTIAEIYHAVRDHHRPGELRVVLDAFVAPSGSSRLSAEKFSFPSLAEESFEEHCTSFAAVLVNKRYTSHSSIQRSRSFIEEREQLRIRRQLFPKVRHMKVFRHILLPVPFMSSVAFAHILCRSSTFCARVTCPANRIREIIP